MDDAKLLIGVYMDIASATAWECICKDPHNQQTHMRKSQSSLTYGPGLVTCSVIAKNKVGNTGVCI